MNTPLDLGNIFCNTKKGFFLFFAMIATAFSLFLVTSILGTPTKAEASCWTGGCNPKTYRGFSYPWCTRFAAEKFSYYAPSPGINWRGDAQYWDTNAYAAGWKITRNIKGTAPGYPLRRGAVVVWRGSYYGHVGNFMGYWYRNGQKIGIIIDEMNYDCPGCVTRGKKLTWSQVSKRGSLVFDAYILPIRR